jgi:hypothetical protein
VNQKKKSNNRLTVTKLCDQTSGRILRNSHKFFVQVLIVPKDTKIRTLESHAVLYYWWLFFIEHPPVLQSILTYSHVVARHLINWRALHPVRGKNQREFASPDEMCIDMRLYSFIAKYVNFVPSSMLFEVFRLYDLITRGKDATPWTI